MIFRAISPPSPSSPHNLQSQETYGPLLLRLPIQRVCYVICNKQQLCRSVVLIRSSDPCAALESRQLSRVPEPSSRGLSWGTVAVAGDQATRPQPQPAACPQGAWVGMLPEGPPSRRGGSFAAMCSGLLLSDNPPSQANACPSQANACPCWRESSKGP